MDWAYKAALTATVVGAVLMAARLFGRHLAGLLAGLPVITAPALLWLANEQGEAYAAASAVGSLSACAAAPLFAWVFERLAQRQGAAFALLAGLGVFALALLTLQPAQAHPAVTLLLAALSSAGVRRAMGPRQPAVQGVRPLRGEPWVSAGLAGLVVVIVTLAAQRLGAFWAGAASTLPIISACALVQLRRAGHAGDLAPFVQGYAGGSFVKALVLFAFWALVPRSGAPLALALGLVVGAGYTRLLMRRPGWSHATLDPRSKFRDEPAG